MKMDKAALQSVIEALNRAGALESVILVGSWAEFLYEECGIFSKDYTSVGKTMDMDFLIKNLRKPKPAVDVIDEITALGFKYNEDYITGISKFLDLEKELEIEFLICRKGNGTKKIGRSNIGINAQEITHMDFVLSNTMKLDFEGYLITVPTPEAYVLQKMIINHKRGLKKEADQEKIARLVPYIDKGRFVDTYKTIYKNEKKLVLEYIKNNPCGLESSLFEND